MSYDKDWEVHLALNNPLDPIHDYIEEAMQTQPQFNIGDRCFSHYTMKWGTVEKIGETRRGDKHGVTDNPLPDTTWYTVRNDDGSTDLLDDAHGDFDMARLVPPYIASRYGYGADPRA